MNRPQCRRDRGYALLITVVLVAAISVTAWATLGEAALTAQTAAARRDYAAAGDWAGAGVRAGLHYLRHPAAAEAAGFQTVLAADGPFVPHFELKPVEGVVVAVTATRRHDGLWTVRGEATVEAGGVRVRQVRRALAEREFGFVASHSVHAQKDLRLDGAWDLAGGARVWRDVGYDGRNPRHPLRARNGRDYGGGDKPDHEAKAHTVPDWKHLHFPDGRRDYVHDRRPGRAVTYHGDRVTGAHVRPATDENPANVVVLTAGTLVAEDVGTFRGTAVAEGDVEVVGRWKIEPEPGMPGLLIGGDLTLHPGAELEIGGLTYLRGRLLSRDLAETSGGHGGGHGGGGQEYHWEWDHRRDGGSADANGPPVLRLAGPLLIEQRNGDLTDGFEGTLRVGGVGGVTRFLSTEPDPERGGNRITGFTVLSRN